MEKSSNSSEFLLQSKEESNSFARRALGGDLSFVEKDGVFHDRKPEASPAQFPTAALVDAVETFENTIYMLLFYTYAIVGIAEIEKAVVFLVAIYRNLHPFSGVSDSIVEKVPENRIQKGMVPMDNGRLGNMDEARNALLFHFLRTFPFYFANQLVKVHVGKVEEVSRLVHAVQNGNVLQKAGQARALRIATFEEKVPFVFREVRRIQDCLQIALYATDGGFQFMGYVLRQLAFDAVFLLLSGDVVDGDFVAIV